MRLEYNFNNQHLEMIEDIDGDIAVPDFNPTPHDSSGLMGELTGDYIRMSVLNEDGSFIRSFYSNLGAADEEVIYTSTGDTAADLTPDTAAIANPSGADIGLEDYPILSDADSLNHYCIDATYTGGYEGGTVIETSADMYYRYTALYEDAVFFDGNWIIVDDGTGAMEIIEPDEIIFTGATDKYGGFFHGVVGIDNGAEYEVSFTTSGYTENGGTFSVNFGNSGTAEWITPVDGQSFTISETTVEDQLYFRAGSNLTVTISDILIRKVTDPLDWILEQETVQVAASVECTDSSGMASTEYALDWEAVPDPQLRIYKDGELMICTGGDNEGTPCPGGNECSGGGVCINIGNNLYVKPNEALELGNINEGNYQLQFDFLHNPFYVLNETDVTKKYYFYITQVSPSRKEVRLVTRDGANDRVPTVDIDGNIEGSWVQQIEGVLSDHNFNFVLVISNARNIPITNYKIDKISDPVNPSLILKLYSPLPIDVVRLANVTIEQEIFTTQIENIRYRTEAYIDPVVGFGLDYTAGFLGIDDVD